MARILIADDDLTQLDLRKLVLESAGHQVRVAFTAGDALRCAREGWASLLILDLRLPEPWQGLGLIREIRESGQSTPILVLAGWPDDLYGQPEARLISSIIEKPVSPAALLEAVAVLTAS